MRPARRHLRQNAIAYLALFCALGGTSYAAFGVPRNSVDAAAIRNHVITPIKFDPRVIGASIRYWAEVTSTGIVVASNTKVRVRDWGTGVQGGVLNFGHPLGTCFALVNAEGNRRDPVGDGFANALVSGGSSGDVTVHTYGPTAAPAPRPVVVAIFCP
jgi:hypothetical protein